MSCVAYSCSLMTCAVDRYHGWLMLSIAAVWCHLVSCVAYSCSLMTCAVVWYQLLIYVVRSCFMMPPDVLRCLQLQPDDLCCSQIPLADLCCPQLLCDATWGQLTFFDAPFYKGKKFLDVDALWCFMMLRMLWCYIFFCHFWLQDTSELEQKCAYFSP